MATAMAVHASSAQADPRGSCTPPWRLLSARDDVTICNCSPPADLLPDPGAAQGFVLWLRVANATRAAASDAFRNDTLFALAGAFQASCVAPPPHG